MKHVRLYLTCCFCERSGVFLQLRKIPLCFFCIKGAGIDLERSFQVLEQVDFPHGYPKSQSFSGVPSKVCSQCKVLRTFFWCSSMQGEVSKFVEQPQTISWARFPQHRASLPKHGLQNRSIYSNCLSDLQTGLPKARWWLWWSKYGLEAQKFTKVMKLDGFSLVGSFKYLNICHVPSYCLILRESMRFWDLSQGFPIYRCSQRTTPPFIGDFQGCAGAKPAALQLSWKQRFGSSARVSVLPGSKLETDKFLIALLAPNCHSKYQISFMCCCMLLLQPWHPSWGICSGWNENLVWIMRTVSSRFKGSACDQRL